MGNIDLKGLGTRIRDHRKEHGLTIEQLAQRAGMSFRSLQTIETGKHSPQLETIQKMAEALGVDSLDLLAGTSEPVRVQPSRTFAQEADAALATIETGIKQLRASLKYLDF